MDKEAAEGEMDPRNCETVSIQFPHLMLFLIKGFAKREGIEYQALIKKWLDEKIMENAKVEK